MHLSQHPRTRIDCSAPRQTSGVQNRAHAARGSKSRFGGERVVECVWGVLLGVWARDGGFGRRDGGRRNVGLGWWVKGGVR